MSTFERGQPVTSLQKRAMNSASEQSNVTFKIEDLLTRASHAGADPQRSLPPAVKRSNQFSTGILPGDIPPRGYSMEQLVNAHLSQMRQEESQQFLDRHTAILVIKKLATGQNARTVIYPTDGSRNVCLIQNSAVVDSAIRRTC